MFKKGSARPVKKGLGVALLILGAAHLGNITSILSIVEPYKWIVGIMMLFAGYLLLISGRQL